MMRRKIPLLSEWLARGLVIGLLLGLFSAVYLWRASNRSGVVEMRAIMSEDGGWTPADLTVPAGEPLRLRLISDDVVHGFAIGQMDWPAIDLLPGKPEETTLVFDKPGRYVYYCTRWCGINHWRMRGVIEVTGEKQAGESASQPPLYSQLGINLDAPHPALVTPELRPSASRAALMTLAEIPAEYQTREYYISQSPAEAWQSLRSEPSLQALDDQQIWDLVARLWRAQSTTEDLQAGAELYAQNCAACHGETGRGDGVMADQLAPEATPLDEHSAGVNHDDPPVGTPQDAISGHTTVGPTDFTDPAVLLGASPALLHGKIVRGGMGTGMPYWGPVLTDDQIWSLVAYLWSFQFER